MKIEDLFKQADTILEDEKLREMFKKMLSINIRNKCQSKRR